MKKFLILVVGLATILLLLKVSGIIFQKQLETKQPVIGGTTMKLISSAFKEGRSIPAKYTCDGDNINPPLKMSDVPTDAKNLVLIVDDPDAPAGDWVHWTLWNITPETTEIAENSVPPGAAQGLTSFGTNRWGGPCPPSGTHRYQFKLYALDTMLDLPTSAKKADLEKAISGHTLSQTTLTGLYQRQ